MNRGRGRTFLGAADRSSGAVGVGASVPPVLRITASCRLSVPTQAGVLRARGGALECAAARVCREAEARVVWNALLRNLNLHLDLDRADDRRVEVIANGLPLWGDAQLAVDTMLVRWTRPDTRVATSGGLRVRHSALQGGPRSSRRCHSVVLALETGGRWSNEVRSSCDAAERVRRRQFATPPAWARLSPGGRRSLVRATLSCPNVSTQQALAGARQGTY